MKKSISPLLESVIYLSNEYFPKEKAEEVGVCYYVGFGGSYDLGPLKGYD
jgi:hypothetical protein